MALFSKAKSLQRVACLGGRCLPMALMLARKASLGTYGEHSLLCKFMLGGFPLTTKAAPMQGGTAQPRMPACARQSGHSQPRHGLRPGVASQAVRLCLGRPACPGLLPWALLWLLLLPLLCSAAAAGY